MHAPTHENSLQLSDLGLPPGPSLRPADCESGIGSRSSTLRSIASSSADPKGRSRAVDSSSINLSSSPSRVVSPPPVCPSCGMPFDKAKKRRLIDACGHERCYSCMFANEACPLCAAARMSGASGRPS
ncbi:hypothetical protein J437_LFUL011220, partial [Ladona fulva]